MVLKNKKRGIRGTFKVGQFIESGSEVVDFVRWPLYITQVNILIYN